MTNATSAAPINAEHRVLIEALKGLRDTKVREWHGSKDDPDAVLCSRADFGIYLIDGLLKQLGVPQAEIEDAEQGPSQPIRVGIRMEGGVIQDVFANQPVVVDVIDYDEDEITDAFEDGVAMLEQDDGACAKCLLRRFPARVMPGEFAKIDAAIVGMEVAA